MYNVWTTALLDSFHAFLTPHKLDKVLQTDLKLQLALDPSQLGAMLMAVGQTRAYIYNTVQCQVKLL